MALKKIMNLAAVLMSVVTVSSLFATMDRFGAGGAYIA